MPVRVGCCGFAEAQDKYFEEFALLEIQKTFYQPPKPQTVKKWRDRAPADFAFTLKAWQLITHEPSSPTYRRLRREIPQGDRGRYGSFRPTPEVFVAWKATRHLAEILRAEAVIFQCPESFVPSREHRRNLEDFFLRIDRGHLRLVWEPRGRDWDAATVGDLCADLDLRHCVDPFKAEAVTGEPFYFRLHGRQGYRYAYSDADLHELRQRCAARDGYVLFNNQSMRKDALRFAELLRAAS